MDFTEARDSEWQWHQLGHMQVCTAPLSFLQAGCPSCRPANSVKALKAQLVHKYVSCNIIKTVSMIIQVKQLKNYNNKA